MTTFQDVIDHLVDYLGGTPTADVQRDCRRAIAEAYRDLANAFRWSYLLTQGRLVTSAPQMAGTLAYDQASRVATLTGATWPTWAPGAFLRVGQVAGKVVSVVDATHALLDPFVNFGVDLAPLTVYSLYRDTYLLPSDYIGGDQALYESNFGGMAHVHPREWLFQERFIFSEGTPRCYTITGDPLFPGRMVIRFAPLPGEAKTIDFLYQRRPRALAIALANAGTVSIASGTTAVTGAGTLFTASMVGSVIRFGDTATNAPTSVVGKYPASFETRVAVVTGATSLGTVDAAPASYAGVDYTISDPIDLEEGAMLNAFLRCCEKHIAMSRTLKDKPSAANQYAMALNEARAADSRSFSGQTVGAGRVMRQRLRDMPISFADTAN